MVNSINTAGNSRFRAGEVAAELKQINRRLDEMTQEWRSHHDWRVEVESRLVAGEGAFMAVRDSLVDVRDEIKALRKADRIVGGFAAVLTAISAAFFALKSR